MECEKQRMKEWIRLGEELEKDAQGMQKRFWSRVKAKERETSTYIRGLDGELRCYYCSCLFTRRVAEQTVGITEEYKFTECDGKDQCKCGL